eukprot:EG_transcript_8770
MTTAMLVFYWMDKYVAINLNQAICQKTSPLSLNFLWPKHDAWEEVSKFLYRNPWISEDASFKLLNDITDIVECWQKDYVSARIELIKVSRDSFGSLLKVRRVRNQGKHLTFSPMFLNSFLRRLARKVKQHGYEFFVVSVDGIATGVKGSLEGAFNVASLDPVVIENVEKCAILHNESPNVAYPRTQPFALPRKGKAKSVKGFAKSMKGKAKENSKAKDILFPTFLNYSSQAAYIVSILLNRYRIEAFLFQNMAYLHQELMPCFDYESWECVADALRAKANEIFKANISRNLMLLILTGLYDTLVPPHQKEVFTKASNEFLKELEEKMDTSNPRVVIFLVCLTMVLCAGGGFFSYKRHFNKKKSKAPYTPPVPGNYAIFNDLGKYKAKVRVFEWQNAHAHSLGVMPLPPNLVNEMSSEEIREAILEAPKEAAKGLVYGVPHLLIGAVVNSFTGVKYILMRVGTVVFFTIAGPFILLDYIKDCVREYYWFVTRNFSNFRDFLFHVITSLLSLFPGGKMFQE